MIQPAVRRAIATTRNRKIGVIGTEGTVKSGAYQDLFSIHPGLEVTAQACPEFVPFVEQGKTSGREVLEVVRGYVAPLREAGVDTLVLGCTHYPLLSGVIQLAVGDEVALVSSAEETSKDVLRVLTEGDMLNDGTSAPTHLFESTGDPDTFDALARRFLAPPVHAVGRDLRIH